MNKDHLQSSINTSITENINCRKARIVKKNQAFSSLDNDSALSNTEKTLKEN